MKMLYGYGYVEGYGDGVHVIKESYETHLLKPVLPKFEEIPGGVIVTAYAADMSKIAKDEQAMRWREMGLNERQQRALQHLEASGQVGRREYVALFDISPVTASRDLADLVARKLLERRGAGRNVRYVLAR